MSFGFGVGDFLAIAQLLDETRKRFKGAPAEYNALADETRTLQIIVNDVKVQAEDDDLTASDKNDLVNALKSCENVLKELNASIDALTELGVSKPTSKKLPQRMLQRLKWDPQQADRLRARLVSAIQLLDAVRQRLDSVQQNHIAQELKKLTVSHDNDKVKDIANWLAAGDYTEHQGDFFSNVHPGTGKWIFTDPVYCKWLDGGLSRLLLSGIPGAGKTMLASNIIHALQDRLTQQDESAVAFFYSSFKRHADQSSLSITSSLVRQLFLQGSKNSHDVQMLYEELNKSELPARPNQKEVSTLLESLLLGFSKVTFIFDALDECQGPNGPGDKPWEDMLTLLYRLQDKLSPKVVVQILATSRPIPEADRYFQVLERCRVQATDDDLATFCDAMIPNIRCIAKKTELHPQIRYAICASAQGMFLLAKLHCDALMAKTKPKDVSESLKKFREGGNALERAYEDTMQRIKSQPAEHEELARRVLTCITFCARPLTVVEVQHALAIDEDTTVLDAEYDLDDPDLMISCCAGLVTVDAQSNVIRLVHYTTQAFLQTLSEGFLLDPHGFIASCCLNYLHLDAFADGHPYVETDGQYDISELREKHRDLREKRNLQYPFLRYSAAYWNHHLSRTIPAIHATKQVMSFLDCPGRISCAFDAYFGRSSSAHGITALHLLARMGADSWIREYINRRHPPVSDVAFPRSCPKCTGLELEQKQLLMGTNMPWERTATSLRDSEGRTSIRHAAFRGNTSTVGILIDLHSQLVNEADASGLTPLLSAIYGAHEHTALRILEEPAVSWKETRENILQRTALHVAANRGCESVVDRLLELDADIPRNEAESHKALLTSVQDPNGVTPLCFAAANGHLSIVKKLLAYSGGRELNVATHVWRCTPGLCAAKFGRLEVLRHLAVQEAFKTDVCDRDGLSLLHLSASSGDVPTLEFVLDMQILPIDALDPRGRTALWWAAYHCHGGAARCLISRHANPEAADDDGVTPLMEAASGHCADVVALLSPSVCNIDSTDNKGKTALHHLGTTDDSKLGDDFSDFDPGLFQSCMDSLLEHGAALDNVRDEKGNSPYDTLYMYATLAVQTEYSNHRLFTALGDLRTKSRHGIVRAAAV
ncbi:hypothetical protein LTR10_016226 [Elasticomyces elasticus]|uniref:NACHT domain-containing protein n=1 Tax=Exophiala sideris TaxID=1016849 RepID=A0ABR0JPS4_9EURO|nr:hypothetical protein LTR10_016226 [Elasticomyces elasticus]KAK5037942.1 hypothetical protein LTS07_001409 [Exophiala sideris]KAK5043925.1 hypothetical protein LTR13_000279 [Exophiala sideris]KAK5067424.1 hypothetical protein LTR69_001411 [Exophiala sideris]KAK5182757.1 hypothetical protein LTR44_005148 [Eurotiomycetes sp. CCFEE 6388]